MTKETKGILALYGGEKIVTINDPHFNWPIIGQDETEAVLKQLKKAEVSYYRCSGIIEQFENEFAEFHNTKYAISTSSGSSALHAAFFSLGLPIGSEVIAPAYTHLGTVFPMLHVGLVPILCDIEEQTGNIDTEKIKFKISENTRAIVVTHQYGHICNMQQINKIAEKYNLFVIEDCSHAHGSRLNNQLAGTFGDIACFSLQSHKVVVAGEGGILITGNKKLADRASLFGHFRQEREYTSEENKMFVESGYGLKNRLHPLAATLAQVQFKKLDETIKGRKENYNYFINELKNVRGLKPLLTHSEADRGGFFRFVFRYIASELERLPIEKYIEALKAEGVSTVSPGSLAKPIHYFNFFQNFDNGFYPIFFEPITGQDKAKLIYKMGDFPKAEEFSANTLQFPAFTLPSFEIIDQYILAMQKVQSNLSELQHTQKSI